MEIFEKYRSMLESIAYRMCGILADAQDIVQETHLKWNAVDQNSISNPRAWLVKVCSRLAMDHAKSARMRRLTYVGQWLPDPLVEDSKVSPAEQHATDDTVSMALMLALERLSPAERASFLLHEVFDYQFKEVAGILGKSEAACRQLATRARMAISSDRTRFKTTAQEHCRLLDAFFEAARKGNMKALKILLAKSVDLLSDSGGKVRTAPPGLRGRAAIAQFFVEIWRGRGTSIRMRHRWFNGGPGMLIYLDGQLLAAICIKVVRGRIRRIYAVRNPVKLTVFEPDRRENPIDGRL